MKKLMAEDPEFSPGSQHTAHVPMSNPTPQAWTYDAELYLVRDETTEATSGLITFTLNPGESSTVDFPITMPADKGTYKVNIDISVSGQLLAAYQATENVTVSPPPANLYARVTDAIDWSIPLPNVKATLNGKVTDTDSGGNFSFLGLSPKTYTLTLEKEGYKTLVQSIELVPGYNEMFFHLTPVTVEKAYFMVSPEWTEVSSDKSERSCTFTITNTGNVADTQDVHWYEMEGYTVINSGVWTITLNPGQSVAKTVIVHHPGSPGDRSAKVQTKQMIGQVIIHFTGYGGAGQLGEVSIEATDTAMVGQKVTFYCKLTNVGTGPLGYRITFYVDDEQTGDSSGSLAPGETRQPGDVYYFTTTGIHTIKATINWDGKSAGCSKKITIS
jgi:uncharacterized membrane protein